MCWMTRKDRALKVGKIVERSRWTARSEVVTREVVTKRGIATRREEVASLRRATLNVWHGDAYY